jgi:hypothetical protein
VQFPGDVHDTDVNAESVHTAWSPAGNTTGRPSAQTPFVDVIVNASSSSDSFANVPTAVQLPGDVQDTELKRARGDRY